MACRVEVYANKERLICDDRVGEVRLETRQILQHYGIALTILSRSGKTRIRQISAESVEI